MRLALFSVVNLVTAVSLSGYAYLQGHGLSGALLTAVAVLIVLQLAYVLWLVVLSRIPDESPADSEAKVQRKFSRSGGGSLTRAESVTGKQAR